jgi:hypothetical protein
MRDAQSWNDAISKGMSLYAGLIFAVLWVGFLIALLANREWLNQVWSGVQALPPVPRLMVWVMLLPIMVGLWIYGAPWPTLGRLAGLAAIVAWTLLAVSSLYKAFR